MVRGESREMGGGNARKSEMNRGEKGFRASRKRIMIDVCHWSRSGECIYAGRTHGKVRVGGGVSCKGKE